MPYDDTMTERDFYAAVRESADNACRYRSAEPDLSVDALNGSFFGRVVRFLTGRWD